MTSCFWLCLALSGIAVVTAQGNLCVTVDEGSSVCTVCVDHAVVVDGTDSCVCDTGFFDTGANVCQVAAPGNLCVTVDSTSNVCTVCVEFAGSTGEADGACFCNIGYFDNAMGQCDPNPAPELCAVIDAFGGCGECVEHAEFNTPGSCACSTGFADTHVNTCAPAECVLGFDVPTDICSVARYSKINKCDSLYGRATCSFVLLDLSFLKTVEGYLEISGDHLRALSMLQLTSIHATHGVLVISAKNLDALLLPALRTAGVLIVRDANVLTVGLGALRSAFLLHFQDLSRAISVDLHRLQTVNAMFFYSMPKLTVVRVPSSLSFEFVGIRECPRLCCATLVALATQTEAGRAASNAVGLGNSGTAIREARISVDSGSCLRKNFVCWLLTANDAHYDNDDSDSDSDSNVPEPPSLRARRKLALNDAITLTAPSSAVPTATPTSASAKSHHTHVRLLANRPDPNSVYHHSVTFGGSGCPAGSVGSSFSSERTSSTHIFDQFVASIGGPIPPAQFSKSCQITYNLHLPQGFSYALIQMDVRGYVQLAAKQTGSSSARYMFHSASQTSVSTVFDGPTTRDYSVRDTLALVSINQQCSRISSLVDNAGLSLSQDRRANGQGQITTDSIATSVRNILSVSWNRC